MTLSERNIVLKRKTSGQEVLRFHDGDIPYFTIPSFDRFGIKNAFSTKFGGISEGCFAEMNLSVSRESPEIVRENYRRLCSKLQMNVNRSVLSWQTHTTNIRRVTEEDAGKGVFRPRDYTDTDGLITDLPDTPLVTLYADCVPLYFYDPVRHCIGLSHSGWRGTLQNMAKATVDAMRTAFNSRPEDLICAVGPSICVECYEVGDEVKNAFSEVYTDEATLKTIIFPNRNGRWQLDLHRANLLNLIGAGVPESNITVTDICTKCNSDLLFSHRVTGEKRGNLAALLSL